jgi:acid stress-induced BolA-like protein IbaG/YrbA
MIQPQEIKQWIEQGLEGAEAQVMGDDGAHFEAIVSCPAFAGKNTLQQHRMVYDALGDKMKSRIHALSLRTVITEVKP